MKVYKDKIQIREEEKSSAKYEVVELKNNEQTVWHFNESHSIISLSEGEVTIEFVNKKARTLAKNNSELRIPKNQKFRFVNFSNKVAKIKIAPIDELVFTDDKRHYKSTDNKTADKIEENQLIQKIYSEVNSNYRHLADIRFKLLGLVPAVSIIVWATLLDKISANNLISCLFGILISVFAIRVIWGVQIYDERNDELYNDLISRGRKIEEETKIKNGIFKGRVKSTKTKTLLKFFRYRINHSTGTNLIYSSVQSGWMLILVYYALFIVKHGFDKISSWL